MASPGNAATAVPGTDPAAALRAELEGFIIRHLRHPGVGPDALDDDAPPARLERSMGARFLLECRAESAGRLPASGSNTPRAF